MYHQFLLETFNPSENNWTFYIKRLEYYFTANDIVDDKKKSASLAVFGPMNWPNIQYSLVDKTIVEIVATLQNHYASAPLPIIQGFKFKSRQRFPEESIPTYIAALQQQENIEFGNTLNDMIRDHLVCGVNDRAIQRRLLQESNLDYIIYKTAYDVAIAMESASKDFLDCLLGVLLKQNCFATSLHLLSQNKSP